MSGGSILSIIALRYLDRRKLKAERVSYEVEMYDKLLASIRKELESRDETIAGLRTRETGNEERVRKLNDEIRKLRQSNRVAEETNLMLKVEIDWMRKMLSKQIGDYERMGVFVLDDSQIVTMSFKNKLEKSSIIDVQVFNDVESFISAIAVKKPKILIIDYYLKSGKTSEDLIDSIKGGDTEYAPNIIIMSKDDREELKDHLYSKGITKFYVKDGLYIFDIVKFVMKYAETILS